MACCWIIAYSAITGSGNHRTVAYRDVEEEREQEPDFGESRGEGYYTKTGDPPFPRLNRLDVSSQLARFAATVAECYHLRMSQPVKLSNELVLDARQTADIAQRSIARQIEYWAQLGRAIDPLLQGAQALALCRSGKAKPLSECLASVDTEHGRRRVAEYLEKQAFPHYESSPDRPGMLVRIDADGTRTTGRFINRRFRKVE